MPRVPIRRRRALARLLPIGPSRHGWTALSLTGFAVFLLTVW
jgi:hypothetical protein